MLATLRQDVRAVRDRDPAARTTLEIILCYPGLHAIWGHRVSHWLWSHDFELIARASAALTRWLTGVDIHPGATLGPGLFIDHATGVVIGETADVGADVTIYQGVTLGGTSLEQGKRHPSVGDRVTIGAGAKVLGPVTIGHDSRIGANAVVVVPCQGIETDRGRIRCVAIATLWVAAPAGLSNASRSASWAALRVTRLAARRWVAARSGAGSPGRLVMVSALAVMPAGWRRGRRGRRGSCRVVAPS